MAIKVYLDKYLTVETKHLKMNSTPSKSSLMQNNGFRSNNFTYRSLIVVFKITIQNDSVP